MTEELKGERQDGEERKCRAAMEEEEEQQQQRCASPPLPYLQPYHKNKLRWSEIKELFYKGIIWSLLLCFTR
jgi:hypothetical protein